MRNCLKLPAQPWQGCQQQVQLTHLTQHPTSNIRHDTKVRLQYLALLSCKSYPCEHVAPHRLSSAHSAVQMGLQHAQYVSIFM